MKIQATKTGFTLTTKNKTVHIATQETVDAERDLVLLQHSENTAVPCFRAIVLPGEYEVTDVLIRGIYDATKAVLYRVTVKGLTAVAVPSPLRAMTDDIIEEIGEQIDVLLLRITSKEELAIAKNIVNELVPRSLLVVSSEPMPEISKALNVALGTLEEDILTLKSADLDDEVTLGWYIPLQS